MVRIIRRRIRVGVGRSAVIVGLFSCRYQWPRAPNSPGWGVSERSIFFLAARSKTAGDKYQIDMIEWIRYVYNAAEGKLRQRISGSVSDSTAKTLEIGRHEKI